MWLGFPAAGEQQRADHAAGEKNQEAGVPSIVLDQSADSKLKFVDLTSGLARALRENNENRSGISQKFAANR